MGTFLGFLDPKTHKLYKYAEVVSEEIVWYNPIVYENTGEIELEEVDKESGDFSETRLYNGDPTRYVAIDGCVAEDIAVYILDGKIKCKFMTKEFWGDETAIKEFVKENKDILARNIEKIKDLKQITLIEKYLNGE